MKRSAQREEVPSVQEWQRTYHGGVDVGSGMPVQIHRSEIDKIRSWGCQEECTEQFGDGEGKTGLYFLGQEEVHLRLMCFFFC